MNAFAAFSRLGIPCVAGAMLVAGAPGQSSRPEVIDLTAPASAHLSPIASGYRHFLAAGDYHRTGRDEPAPFHFAGGGFYSGLLIYTCQNLGVSGFGNQTQDPAVPESAITPPVGSITYYTYDFRRANGSPLSPTIGQRWYVGWIPWMATGIGEIGDEGHTAIGVSQHVSIQDPFCEEPRIHIRRPDGTFFYHHLLEFLPITIPVLTDFLDTGHRDLMGLSSAGADSGIIVFYTSSGDSPESTGVNFGWPVQTIELVWTPDDEPIPVSLGNPVKADFFGDGIDDVVVMTSGGAVILLAGSEPDARAAVVDVTGPNQLAHKMIVLPSPGTYSLHLVSPGDINGDGHDDFIINGSSFSTPSLIFFGGPNSSQHPEPVAVPGARFSMAGDFDGDGTGDILVETADDMRLAYGGPHLRAHLTAGDSLAALHAHSTLLVIDDAGGLVNRRVRAVGDMQAKGASSLAVVMGEDGIEGLQGWPNSVHRYMHGSPADMAVSHAFLRPGSSMRRGVGADPTGRHGVPRSAAWLRYQGGDNAAGGPSLHTVEHHRGHLVEIAPGMATMLASSRWHVTSDRTGFDYLEVTLRYPEQEGAGMPGDLIRVLHGPTREGPWEALPVIVVDTETKRVTAVSEREGWFAVGIALDASMPQLICLTEFGDVWRSVLLGDKVFSPPTRLGNPGLRHDPPNGFKVLLADWDGDGVPDLLQVRDDGSVTLVRNLGDSLAEPELLSTGWFENRDAGMGVFMVDVFDRGIPDVVMVEDNLRVRYSLNNEGALAPPSLTAAFEGLRYNATNVVLAPPSVEPVLYSINNESRVIHSLRPSQTNVLNASFGSMFHYRPEIGHGVVLGRFRSETSGWVYGWDVVSFQRSNEEYMWPYPEARVARAQPPGATTAGFFDAATTWNDSLGFHMEPGRGKGWWVFAFDVDRDGRDDLLQLTEHGHLWWARSTGSSFAPPQYLAGLGFHHQPDGPWHVLTWDP